MPRLTHEKICKIFRPQVLDAVGRICHRAERDPELTRELLEPIVRTVAHLVLNEGGWQRRELLRGDVQKVKAVMSRIERAAPNWEAKESGILADRILADVMERFPPIEAFQLP